MNEPNESAKAIARKIDFLSDADEIARVVQDYADAAVAQVTKERDEAKSSSADAWLRIAELRRTNLERAAERDKALADLSAAQAKLAETYERISWLAGQREIEVRQKEDAFNESGECLREAAALRTETYSLQRELTAAQNIMTSREQQVNGLREELEVAKVDRDEAHALYKLVYETLSEGFELNCLSIQAPRFAIDKYKAAQSELQSLREQLEGQTAILKKVDALYFGANEILSTLRTLIPIGDLVEAVRELVRDKAMLDWLDENGHTAMAFNPPNGPYWHLFYRGFGCVKSDTLRAAIDAALSTGETKETK